MSFYQEMLDKFHAQWVSDLEHHWGREHDLIMKHLNPTNMNESKSLAGQPAITETPAEQLNAGTGLGKVMDAGTPLTSPSIDVKATVEELAKDNDALAKAFADVNGIGKEEPITDEEYQALVIKSVMDTAYAQILETRGPGAWEAEFKHASAVAQTF